MTTLSMWASNLPDKTDPVYENNVFTATPRYQLLRSMAILGANASGKSNLVKAFYAFVTTVAQSTKDERILAEYIKPFVLNTLPNRSLPFFNSFLFWTELNTGMVLKLLTKPYTASGSTIPNPIW